MIKNRLVPKNGNDVIMTPDELAFNIVQHYKPYGLILEPCSGEGSFIRAFEKFGLKYEWCEIERGRNFLDFKKSVDWIITNPPWSKTRVFLKHSYTISNNIVFLITINHILALSARWRDMHEAGFGVKECLFIKTPPKPWPQSGFQLGAIYLQKDWCGPTTWSKIKGT